MLMDELADALRMDPLEFRLKNLPPQAPNAMWGKYFPMGAERFGWSKRHATGDPTPGPIKRGLGCAANRWGGGGRGAKAHCEINADGSVVMRCGTQDIGAGTQTIMTMIAAETLGLPMDVVKAELGDSNYPFSGGSGGSTTAPAVSPAMRVTAGKALDALFARIAPALGVDRRSWSSANGSIQSKDDASKGLSWKDACKMLGTEPVSVDGEWEAGLSASGTSGVQFAEVEVDIETGVTKVKNIVCVQDCGLILDELTAESQCIGGIIRGVNYALFEDRILDRNTGHMVNPNMEWYLLAGPSDIPKIDVKLMNQPERGVIGIGEPPTISTAAAIANAVRNAIGVTRAKHPDHAGQSAHGDCRARGDWRHAVKAFAYVNAANEKEAVAALATATRGKILPMAGGMDLLGLMKDYIAQPDVLVNVKKLPATITAPAQGLTVIGAAAKLADVAEHAALAEGVSRVAPTPR